MRFVLDPDGVDLELEELTVEPERPKPGDVVTVTATIRNMSFRPKNQVPDENVDVEVCLSVNDLQVPDCTLLPVFDGELLFNERKTFERSYRSTGRPETIEVDVFFGPDLDTTNQSKEMTVCRWPGPQALTLAAVQPRGSGGVTVDAGWQPPPEGDGLIWSYRVYRGPAETGPWDLLGFTSGQTYTDAAPDEEIPYYAVEAYDQLNRQSDKTVAYLVALVEVTDDDTVVDAADVCPGFDDRIDTDGDGVPNGCDVCPGPSAPPGSFDDRLDIDNDGVPDGCDHCRNLSDSAVGSRDQNPARCAPPRPRQGRRR